ncbi:MAG: nitroreductase [Candidatus Bruticola sp.]
MNEVIASLKSRRSIRRYDSLRTVPQNLIEEIIEAGLCAASAMNKQPTIIIEITDKETRDQLAALNGRIGGWAEGFDPFYGAPVVLVVMAEKNNKNHVYDGSLVMGNLMTAAHALGLGCCWINRAKEESECAEGQEIFRRLGVPEGYEGIGHCILGYAAESPKAHPIREGRVIKH